jgi:ATP-dependent DNA helicase UvrD/PcrA
VPRAEIQAIVGPPGSGKTTYIGRQARRAVKVFTKEKVVVLSMTRAAAAAAAEAVALPERAISTLHSACFRGLECPALVDDREENYLETWNRAFPGMALASPDRKRVDPYDKKCSHAAGDALRAEYELARSRLTPRDAWRSDVRTFARRFEAWKRDLRLCDFPDLIERALEKLPTCPGEPAAMFIDEAQDHSALEIALIKRWAGGAHTTVLVGDPFQAIYQWRGASPRLFLAGTATPITLARSYRLPRAVHAEAERLGRSILPELARSYLSRDEDGMVQRFPTPFDEPEKISEMIEGTLVEGSGRGHGAADDAGQATVMFIASCGYMLEPVLQVLRDRAVPYANYYVADDEEWNPLPHGRALVEALFAPLRQQRFWSYLELDALAGLLPADSRKHPELDAPPCLFPHGARAEIRRRLKENAQGDPVADDGDGLDAVIHYSRAMDLVRILEDAPHRLVAWLERHGLPKHARAFRFALAVQLRHGEVVLSERPRLTIGTIHSVKGGEADHVIAWSALSPAGLMSPIVERLCLAYVAMTRARRALRLFTAPAGVWRLW